MSVLDDDLSPEAKAAYDSLLQAYVDWTVRTMDSLVAGSPYMMSNTDAEFERVRHLASVTLEKEGHR